MPENTEDKSKYLFARAADEFDEHSKRIGAMLNKAQEKFDHDYTSYTAVSGTAFIVVAVALAWLGKAESFCIALAIIGALMCGVAIVLRHRSADRQAHHTRTLLELERERARFAQRSAVLQHVWIHGMPQNIPMDQISFLLGDRTSPPKADDTLTVIPPANDNNRSA